MQATGDDGTSDGVAREVKGKRLAEEDTQQGGGAPKKPRTDVSNHGKL